MAGCARVLERWDMGKPARPVACITFYTRPECGLCEDAKAILQALQQEWGFEIVEVDITQDPDLNERFREEIPVAFLDGRKLFKYRVDPARLGRQLQRRRGWVAGRWFSSSES